MLLQVMSEEQASNFATEDAGNGLKRITDIGHDPWQVKALNGIVRFQNHLTIQPLDINGYARGAPQSGRELRLLHSAIYYSVTR